MNKDNIALNERFKGTKNELYLTLKKKSEFISFKYRSELTGPIMKKLQIEEEHIKICLEFIENAEKLITSLNSEIETEKKKVAFFKEQTNEYIDKYFNSLDLEADYKLFKAQTK